MASFMNRFLDDPNDAVRATFALCSVAMNRSRSSIHPGIGSRSSPRSIAKSFEGSCASFDRSSFATRRTKSSITCFSRPTTPSATSR